MELPQKELPEMRLDAPISNEDLEFEDQLGMFKKTMGLNSDLLNNIGRI